MHELNNHYATAEHKNERVSDASSAVGYKCPHCGATISEDCEICPSCGRRVVSWCTFCGAPMEWSDSECPECGAPADGIKCPSCGTLSFRSFCPHCNTPLTRAAARMVEVAKSDPVCVEAAAQSAKAAELERTLEIAPAAEVPRIKQELVKVTADLNTLLEQMLPPAGSTPQEQRNYYSARKVAVESRTLTRVKVGWVCNYCGCTHPNPADCCKPFLGGKWVYEDKVDTRIDYVK